MNTTQIDRENISNIQSDNFPDRSTDKLEFDYEALTSLESGDLGWEECVNWWREKYELLTEEQKIEAISHSKNWLQTATNKYWKTDYGYRWYLKLIDLYGSQAQKQEVINQATAWIKANKDESNQVRCTYLFLVNKYGGWQDKDKAIARTTTWLERKKTNSNTSNIWIEYIKLIESQGSLNQKQKTITKIANWLNTYSEDVNLWQKYLTLVEKYADKQQKQQAIDKTASWLKAHPDDSMVRTKYMKTIAEKGTLKQKKKIIDEIGAWLQTYSQHPEVYRQYLVILGKYGTPQQQAEAIALTTSWLQENPEKGEIRKQYLCLLRQCDDKKIDIYSAIRQQWSWIECQEKVNHQLWTVFLPLLYKYAEQHSDIIPAVADLALEQESEHLLTICMVFGNFRDYLDRDRCYQLAEFISQKPLPMNLWLNTVHAANFFRHHGELEKAEAIYQSILSSILPHYQSYETAKEIYAKFTKAANFKAKQYKTTPQKIIQLLNYTYLNYGWLLLSGETPDVDKAIEYTKVALEHNPQNSLAHWQMTKCYRLKGDRAQAETIASFQKAIKFERKGTGRISYDFGQFYRTVLGDLTNARMYLEKSLEQEITLETCLELVELEIEDGNFERAEHWLELALTLIPTSRSEQEQHKEMQPRLQLALDSLSNL